MGTFCDKMSLINIFRKIKESADVPVFRKCFCFVPLRKGLLAWGYINVLAALTVMIFGVMHLAENMIYPRPYYGSYAAMFVVFFIVQLANMAYSILLIIAGHKNSEKLLEHYYFFAMGKLVVCTISIIVISIHTKFVNDLWYYYSMDEFWYYLLRDNPALEVIHIIVQLYFLLLVRSELLDMRNVHIPTAFQNNLYFDTSEKYLIPAYKDVDEDFTNSVTEIITKILEKEQEKKSSDILNTTESTAIRA